MTKPMRRSHIGHIRIPCSKWPTASMAPRVCRAIGAGLRDKRMLSPQCRRPTRSSGAETPSVRDGIVQRSAQHGERSVEQLLLLANCSDACGAPQPSVFRGYYRRANTRSSSTHNCSAADGYHQHPVVLAEDLVVSMSIAIAVLAPNSEARCSISEIADLACFVEPAFVGRGSSADDVSDNREHIPEYVRADDGFSGHDTEVAGDRMPFDDGRQC